MDVIAKFIDTPVNAYCYMSTGECGVCYYAELTHDDGVLYAYECACGKFGIGTDQRIHQPNHECNFRIDDGFTNLQSGWPEPKFIRDLCRAAIRVGMVRITNVDAKFLQKHLTYDYTTFNPWSYKLCDGVNISIDSGMERTINVTVVDNAALSRNFLYDGPIVTLFDKMIEEYTTTINKVVAQSLEKGLTDMPQDVAICTRIVAALRGLQQKSRA